MTLAWYFAREDRKLRYGDGRKIVVGKSHLHRGEPEVCESGLHASVNILDALDHAPGPILYRVRLGGRLDVRQDKIAATKRTYLAEIDATALMRDFARACALDVIHLWDAPPVVREYLETGSDDLRDAAWAAAQAAARDAAWAAAQAAAQAAARDAAWAAFRPAAQAAWAAARAAARDAARDAAREAAREEQNNRLTAMAFAAMRLSDG